MASGINEAALTLAALEVMNTPEFILEKVFQKGNLADLHNVQTGITMKQQIILAGQFGKTGLLGDATCTRKTSGASSVLTQKYWEPAGIEDTLVHCQAEVDSLFKAYYTKITQYIQRYELGSSELATFMAMLVEESMKKTISRAVWFGDKTVAAAQAALAGLIVGGNSVYYDYINGLWSQIFAAVTALTVKKYAITENTQVTLPLQLTLAADRALAIFEGVWALADPRLKADPSKKLMVSGAIFENYRQSLMTKGIYTDLAYTTNGFPSLKWNGIEVVNMESIWDLDLFADFVDNTVNNAGYLPNRVILTTPENIPVGTLNQSDFTDLEIWYEKATRTNNIGYGFSIDTKLLEEYMIVVGF